MIPAMDADLIEKNRRGLQFYLGHMRQVIERIRYRIKPISLEGCYSSLENGRLVIDFLSNLSTKIRAV
ncbi:hypothetical protein DOT66_24245 [Ralstonia pseudosolanacearum]|nr:hypothetical protein BLA34_22670 [Ralstonia solanacearum]RAA04734.1 hypothetical protein DOT66_24245 [Ralstonia pseudosolanacearum]